MDIKRDKIRAVVEKDRKKLADINKEIEDSLQYIGNTASTACDRVSIKVLCLDWITKRLTASHDNTIALLNALDSAEKRVESEEVIRSRPTREAFEDTDISYLCMLASHGSAVVRSGWLHVFAKKIKMALSWKAENTLSKKALEQIGKGEVPVNAVAGLRFIATDCLEKIEALKGSE